MRQFAAAKGYIIVDERKEIASGLNENRKQLLPLLSRKDYDVLIVEHKDRLSRFGSTYIEQALINNGVKLEIINKIENKEMNSLMILSLLSQAFVAAFMDANVKRKHKKS